MNDINVTEHKCKGKCPEFKGEQCNHCIIPENDVIALDRNATVPNDGAVAKTERLNRCNSTKLESMGDDTHIENHVSPLCVVDFSKNDSQTDLSIKDDALNRMESCYIDKKKQVEQLQTEVARLNAVVERLKTENLAMQARIDELTAENAQVHQAATTHFRNQNHYMDLYHKLVCELYPYALDLGERVACKDKPQDYIDGYNRSGAATSASLLEMMQGDEEYIRMQCDMLGDEA